MKEEKELSLDEIRLDLLNFCKEIGAIFMEQGEIGFGRPCVGITNGRACLSYSPSLSDDRCTPLKDLWDEAIDPPASVEDSYHKGDYMAVLIHDDDEEKALRQLHIWIEHIRKAGGAKLITFVTGASGAQALFSGLSETAIVSKPFFEKMKERIDDLHPAIDRSIFEEDQIEAEAPDDHERYRRLLQEAWDESKMPNESENPPAHFAVGFRAGAGKILCMDQEDRDGLIIP